MQNDRKQERREKSDRKEIREEEDIITWLSLSLSSYSMNSISHGIVRKVMAMYIPIYYYIG